MSSLRISILGAGDIGGTLGRKWAKAGHRVAFGVKDPSSEKAQSLRQDLGEDILIGSPTEALTQSDVVLLAVPGSAVNELITTHAQLLDHKTIIDATNQIVKGKTTATNTWQGQGTLNSLGTLQAHAPHARLYRAFNSYAWEEFADPVFQGVQADLFYCGPQGDALAIVEQLIAEIGLRPVRLGDVDQVEVVDEILRLWASLALFQGLGRDKVAFKMLTR
ncbi:MAG TPA: NAD(P)-binding domain-containing protein [Ktedonobacteraceae bacterium]|nr:NAD(P)-binding domain-containing protein [Ktedonobacteraceae bacterium]